MVEVINTFLLDGDVYGRKVFKALTHSVTLSVFPKNNIVPYGDESVLEENCVYFLLNISKKEIYIGQTGNLVKRLIDHSYNKSFWDTLYVFTSPDFEIHSSLIEDIEKVAISAIMKQKEWNYTNKRIENEEKIDGIWKELCDNYFETMKVLANMAGCQVFPSKRISSFSEQEQIKRNKREVFSPNQTKAQIFCFGKDQIINGVGNLLKNFASRYLELHGELPIKDFVKMFNEKVKNEHPFYAFEDTVVNSSTEKLYKDITVNGQKLFYLRRKQSAGDTIAKAMTEFGVKTIHVDKNSIIYPCGLYKYKGPRANIQVEIRQDSVELIVKKESYKIESKEGKKSFPYQMDTRYNTFNQIYFDFTGGSGGNFQKNFIFEDGRKLSQIEEQLLIEQANQMK